MRNIKVLSAVCILLGASMLSGCAKHPDKIPAQYTSPIQYEGYSCTQIASEMQRLSARVSELRGRQERAATGDSVKMGVGLILFWPTLFFLEGNSTQAAEYAKIKGEFDALEKVANLKGCGIEIARREDTNDKK